MKMHFGKYKGRELSELPPTYLRWLLSLNGETWERIGVTPEMKEEARAILEEIDYEESADHY